ncbi:MAG: hypothetical protein ABW022_09530 [Actinoplanes sp.]
MLLEGFWTLLDPARPAQLLLGLAVVAAALLIAVALALPVLAPAAPAVRVRAHRVRPAFRPRLADPDAAGRPRSRAPSLLPAA